MRDLAAGSTGWTDVGENATKSAGASECVVLKAQGNLLQLNSKELRGNGSQILYFVLFQSTSTDTKCSGLCWRPNQLNRMLFHVTEPNWR